MNVSTQNKRGEWVPAIPEPYFGIRKMCNYSENSPSMPSLHYCGERFWTYEGYREHYALKHILAL